MFALSAARLNATESRIRAKLITIARDLHQIDHKCAVRCTFGGNERQHIELRESGSASRVSSPPAVEIAPVHNVADAASHALSLLLHSSPSRMLLAISLSTIFCCAAHSASLRCRQTRR
uniref:Uncharacterized protein n=1 Tax=Anopheles melas TaxID=34690 RepID=A0A182U2L0_9DIPT